MWNKKKGGFEMLVLEDIYKKSLEEGFDNIKAFCKEEAGFIFARDDNGDTLLHLAVYDGNFEMVKSLMEIGACPLIYNEKGMDVLANATALENVKVLNYLIQRSLLSLTDFDKSFLLAQAAGNGILENVKCLLEYDFPPSNSYQDRPMLIWGVQSGNLDVVKLLCKPSFVNDSDEEGMTALYQAASDGMLDIVTFLLNEGAIVDQATNNNVTPFMIASCCGHAHVVECLLEHGANIDVIETDEKMTPLLYAVEYGNIEVVRCLLKHGANVNHKNKKGKTALLYAIKAGDVETVTLLLENGANPNIVDNKGQGVDVYLKKIRSKKKQADISKLIEQFRK